MVTFLEQLHEVHISDSSRQCGTYWMDSLHRL